MVRILKWLFQPAYLLLVIVLVALYVNREALFSEEVTESLEAGALIGKVDNLVERLRSDADAQPASVQPTDDEAIARQGDTAELIIPPSDNSTFQESMPQTEVVEEPPQESPPSTPSPVAEELIIDKAFTAVETASNESLDNPEAVIPPSEAPILPAMESRVVAEEVVDTVSTEVETASTEPLDSPEAVTQPSAAPILPEMESPAVAEEVVDAASAEVETASTATLDSPEAVTQLSAAPILPEMESSAVAEEVEDTVSTEVETASTEPSDSPEAAPILQETESSAVAEEVMDTVSSAGESASNEALDNPELVTSPPATPVLPAVQSSLSAGSPPEDAAASESGSATIPETPSLQTAETVSPLAIWHAARTAVWQGDLIGAVSHYRQLIAVQPDNYDAYGEMGNVLLAQSEGTAAVEAYVNAARLIYRSGNIEMARRLAGVIAQLDEGQGRALFNEFSQ